MKDEKLTPPPKGSGLKVDSGETKHCQGPCGRELSLDEFSNNKSRKDGKDPFCRQCKAEKQRAYRERKKAGDEGGRVEKKTAKQAPVKNWPAPEAGVGQQENKKVSLDFSHYPGLYLKLKEAAEKDFRTPELQALFLIFRGMKGSSCEWPQFVDYYKLNGQKIKAEMDLARAKVAYTQKAVEDAKEIHGEDSAEYQKAVNKMALAAEDLKEVSHEPTT